MGRLHKEYAWAINQPGNRPGKEERVYYRHALELYEQAYRLRKHYYPGINVATLKLLLDDEKEARDVAKDVLETCYRATPADVVERNWIIATQGEAYLILKEFKLAIAHYRMAMSLDHDQAYAESPRRHARCILAKRPPENPAQKKEVLSALRVRSRS